MDCSEIPSPSSFSYRCDVCQESSISRGKRNIHCRISSLESCFVCKDCNRPFSLGYELTVTKEESHLCYQCGAIFSSKELLEIHSQHHAGQVPCRCNVCSRASTNKSKLHINLLHQAKIKESENECDVCHKKFSNRFRLKRHNYVHTGLWPYRCEYCEKGLPDKRSLRIHLRKHTLEKPYACIDCDSKFTTKGHMMTHFSKFHGGWNYLLEISDSKNVSAIIIDPEEKDQLTPFTKVVNKIDEISTMNGL
ncbi:zinc finger protein [Trichonephila inaurata madagascariensis]|uniref:Zinc finger protein n=1 Tax=Trichonephila inaurata madagascariensis TaxID=2747483 RepID=A0A8X6YIK7_9ARAC|nr:zinc finger protein [Trichonephila inaurata madagascariensis]